MNNLCIAPAMMEVPKSRAEAIERGLGRYYTGKSCKHGHVAERQTNNGTCVICRPLILLKFNECHPGQQAVSSNEFRRKHPDRAKKHAQNTYQKHKVKRLAHNREYRQANRQKIYVKAKEYIVNNPELIRSIKHNNRAKRKLAEGTHSKSDIKKLFTEQGGKCACCQTDLGGHQYHVDHIIPIARGGSNWPENLQLLCKTCNLRKGAKDPVDFMREMGRLL